MQVNMLEAKTQLSKLVEAALRGEDVVIANRGKPMVKLVKADPPHKREWGVWEGLISEEQIDAAFAPEFEAELAADWERRAAQPIFPPEPPQQRTAGGASRKAARKSVKPARNPAGRVA